MKNYCNEISKKLNNGYNDTISLEDVAKAREEIKKLVGIQDDDSLDELLETLLPENIE